MRTASCLNCSVYLFRLAIDGLPRIIIPSELSTKAGEVQCWCRQLEAKPRKGGPGRPCYGGGKGACLASTRIPRWGVLIVAQQARPFPGQELELAKVAAMFKAVHEQEDRKSAAKRSKAVEEKRPRVAGPNRHRAKAEPAALAESLYEAVCAHPGETMAVLAPTVSSRPPELQRPMMTLKQAGHVRSAWDSVMKLATAPWQGARPTEIDQAGRLPSMNHGPAYLPCGRRCYEPRSPARP